MVQAVVGVPVRNEEERIGACLRALGAQEGVSARAFGVVLLVNNTSDGTVATIEAARAGIPVEVRIVVRDSRGANAGWARREAMEVAADWLGSERGQGALLTTDADSQVAPDWVARNLAALAGQADAIAGTVALDPADAARLSPALRARGVLEAEYHALLDELAAAMDPDPGDPWPNHSVESGASLAVTLPAYRQVGGIPPVALGDDRAFCAALRAHGFTIRHDPSVRVLTSGRLVGRAAGGVADTMRARQDQPDCPCDARLEPFTRALFRLRWRRRLRLLHEDGRLKRDGRWLRLLGIAAPDADAVLSARRTGELVAQVERVSSRLSPAPLRPRELPAQIEAARVHLLKMP